MANYSYSTTPLTSASASASPAPNRSASGPSSHVASFGLAQPRRSTTGAQGEYLPLGSRKERLPQRATASQRPTTPSEVEEGRRSRSHPSRPAEQYGQEHIAQSLVDIEAQLGFPQPSSTPPTSSHVDSSPTQTLRHASLVSNSSNQLPPKASTTRPTIGGDVQVVGVANADRFGIVLAGQNVDEEAAEVNWCSLLGGAICEVGRAIGRAALEGDVHDVLRRIRFGSKESLSLAMGGEGRTWSLWVLVGVPVVALLVEGIIGELTKSTKELMNSVGTGRKERRKLRESQLALILATGLGHLVWLANWIFYFRVMGDMIKG